MWIKHTEIHVLGLERKSKKMQMQIYKKRQFPVKHLLLSSSTQLRITTGQRHTIKVKSLPSLSNKFSFPDAIDKH